MLSTAGPQARHGTRPTFARRHTPQCSGRASTSSTRWRPSCSSRPLTLMPRAMQRRSPPTGPRPWAPSSPPCGTSSSRRRRGCSTRSTRSNGSHTPPRTRCGRPSDLRPSHAGSLRPRFALRTTPPRCRTTLRATRSRLWRLRAWRRSAAVSTVRACAPRPLSRR
eukprot:Amastigsp_a347724_3.p2 type:complete len:165 gc:universal Amastigsp_a347724_3:407-901(+)